MRLAADKEVIEKFSVNPPNVYGFGHQAYYQHVVDCLINQRAALVDGLEGRRSLELITALYESIETGQEVSLRIYAPKLEPSGRGAMSNPELHPRRHPRRRRLALDVKVVEPCNLYGCTIGDDCFIGPFTEIQRGCGDRCKRSRVQSHAFVCELVTIGEDCFIGHGVMFINDTFAWPAVPAGGKKGALARNP